MRLTVPTLAAALLLNGCYGKSEWSGGAPPSPPPTTATDPAAATACEPSGELGATALQRITREQYANATKDLLPAVTVDPAPMLPHDEKLGAFAANTATLASAALLEHYQFAAEQIGKQVAADVQRFAPCEALSADAGNDDQVCAATFIRTFGRRAFRKSLSDEDVQRWQNLFTKASASSDYAGGIRSVVEGMLQSPRFLYHLELLPPGVAPEATEYPVDGNALAARLSYFLWNSGPDDALLQAAEEGALATAEQVAAHAARMLEDERARRSIDSFTSGWLELESLSTPTGGAEREGVPESTRKALAIETMDFVDEVLRRGDGRFETLLTASWTTAAPEVLELYGVTADPSGVTQLNPAERAGVLTHASVLYAHAHAEQTSPVLRGKWVRESLLCQSIADPPDDVNASPPAPVPGQSTRERYEEHRNNPACAGCHVLLDDVGFGFEAYDMVGRFRTMEGGKPVDDRGLLVDTDVDGDFRGATELANKLAVSEFAQACFATQWFRFALARPERDGDSCTVADMREAITTEDGFKRLVDGLVQSKAFRTRRTP